MFFFLKHQFSNISIAATPMPAVYSSKEQNFLEHQFGNVSIVATLMSAVYSSKE